MARTMTDEQEAVDRGHVEVSLATWPENEYSHIGISRRAFTELDATRAQAAELERERDELRRLNHGLAQESFALQRQLVEAQRLAGTMSRLRDQGERAYDAAMLNLAAREAECAELRNAGIAYALGEMEHFTFQNIVARPAGSCEALRSLLEQAAMAGLLEASDDWRMPPVLEARALVAALLPGAPQEGTE